MPKIEITPQCHRAIRGAAIFPFRETGVLLPNGNWRIDVDAEVFSAISRIQAVGETMSDTIERVIMTSGRTPS